MRPLTQRAMEPTKSSFSVSSWDAEVESATAPDGHVRVHQSQAPPLSIGLPSGLARSQQLYMMQRFLNIPATPSYVKDDGGLVLDRVVMNVGGRTWWQTLTLRLRAQRAWNTPEFSKGKPHHVLGDPSMYALGGRFRVGFGAHTVLRGLGELGSLSGAVEDFRKFKRRLRLDGAGEDADESNARNAPKGIKSSNKFKASNSYDDDISPRGRVTLQTKAISGHLVSCDASLRERYQTPTGYKDGPSFVSFSLASRGSRWFNYKLGVRQWLDNVIPPFERGVDQGGNKTVTRPPPRREATAGASVEHQVTLWRGKRRPTPQGKGGRPGGYTALPQTPCVVVGALVGGTARIALADDSSGDDVAGTSSSAQTSLGKGQVDHRQCVSVTAHASFGSFSRPLLDYTSVDFRYDLGSTSSGGMNGDAPLMDAKDAPKTMMEKMIQSQFAGSVKVESEMFTIGATQQVIGPVRARAELRIGPGAAGRAARAGWGEVTKKQNAGLGKQSDASKPPVPPRGSNSKSSSGKYGAKPTLTSSSPSSAGNQSRMSSAWRAARREAPNAELVYGVDCPLPPALGAARLVAWYNVTRGEAQAEMRLFDL